MIELDRQLKLEDAVSENCQAACFSLFKLSGLVYISKQTVSVFTECGLDSAFIV